MPEPFQSRNRDACHFRAAYLSEVGLDCLSFQSRNRDACHFRVPCVEIAENCILFQSRNRDACHFRMQFGISRQPLAYRVSISQSRCLSFQVERPQLPHAWDPYVSISQSRCLSFQANSSPKRRSLSMCFNLAIEMLVISGRLTRRFTCVKSSFQSRNRDACHFRMAVVLCRRGA